MGASDVAIIGAGPAGLLAGSVLAAAGYGVQIFERRSLPIDKVCGEGLLPGGVAQLQQLGFPTADLASLGEPFAGITLVSGGVAVPGAFPAANPGYGIERRRLSAWLAAAALARGVQLTTGRRLVGVSQTAEGWRLHLRVGGEVAAGNVAGARPDLQDWRCRYLLACDGLRSRTVAALGIERRQFRPQRMGFRFYVPVRAASRRQVVVIWGRGYEVYLTPLARDRVGVAVLAAHQPCPSVAAVFALARAACSTHRDTAHWGWDFSAASAIKAYGPFGSRIVGRQPAGFGALGDAYCFKDGITGDGLTLVTYQVALLRQHLAQGGVLGDRQWQRLQARLLRRHLLLSGLALGLNRLPKLRHGLGWVAAWQPSWWDRLLGFHAAVPGVLRSQ